MGSIPSHRARKRAQACGRNGRGGWEERGKRASFIEAQTIFKWLESWEKSMVCGVMIGLLKDLLQSRL